MTTEQARFEIDPTMAHERRVLCPHCDQRLPVTATTECDRCGAHLELHVATVVPPVGE